MGLDYCNPAADTRDNLPTGELGEDFRKSPDGTPQREAGHRRRIAGDTPPEEVGCRMTAGVDLNIRTIEAGLRHRTLEKEVDSRESGFRPSLPDLSRLAYLPVC